MAGRTAEHGRALGIAGVALAAIFSAGCTSANSPREPVVIASGQLLPGEVPAAADRASAAASPGTTIPLAKQNPTTALFSAIGVFQSCLSGLGVTFIGAPNPQDPQSPANNPSYVKNLVTCATKSDILQALQAASSAQNNLTPAQVEKENKDYLLWRKCMIGRGWQIAAPTPDAKGLLFSFGTAGSTSQFQPPPGQSLLSSNDIEDCAELAEQGRS